MWSNFLHAYDVGEWAIAVFNDGDSVDKHEMAGLLTNEELLCMQTVNWETGKGVLWNHEDAESGLKVMLMRKLESQTSSDGNVTKKVSILMLEGTEKKQLCQLKVASLQANKEEP